MSPIVRRIPHDFDVAPQSEEEEIMHNLEGIARGVPNYARFDDVPRAYQRHTMGVSNRVHCLLRRLIRSVTCYHDHHVN